VINKLKMAAKISGLMVRDYNKKGMRAFTFVVYLVYSSPKCFVIRDSSCFNFIQQPIKKKGNPIRPPSVPASIAVPRNIMRRPV
jgi:hypothetical protein